MLTKKNKNKAKNNPKDNNSNFSPIEKSTSSTKIKIIGIGGGGSSIISEISTTLKRVDFIATNTDKRALASLEKKIKTFQFGEKVTGGLGTGMNPELGRTAALEEKEKIKKILEGYDLCIFVSCLGGGTGSGATPVFTKIAKDLGIITYGIFTLPFNFEGSRKVDIATEALNESRDNLNAITILPNENIFKIIDKKTPLKNALSLINKNLSESLQGLIEMLYDHGLINIDFADLRTILKEKKSLAYLSTGFIDTTKGSEDIVKDLVSSPFYSYSITRASGIVFNITGGSNLSLKDVSLISEGISERTEKKRIIFGVSQNRALGDKIKITLLAMGCCWDSIFIEDKGKKPQKKIKKSGKSKSLKIKVNKKNGLVDQKTKKKETADRKKEVVNPVKDNQKETRKNKNNPTKKREVSINVRKSAIQIKKESEDIEKEILENDNQWETPAFLRKPPLKDN